MGGPELGVPAPVDSPIIVVFLTDPVTGETYSSKAKVAPALGSSNDNISQEGGKCGYNGVYQAPVFICASGLTCQSSGLDGAYGTCTAPSLGETRHAQEGEGCACESCGPEAWSIPCASGLVCVGNTFEHGDDFVDDGYKTCQKPSLGASGGCWSDNGCPHGEYCLGAGMLIMGVPQMGTCHA